MRLQELRGKRVAVWGIGKEGLAMLRLLRNRLPACSVTILNDSEVREVTEGETILIGENALKSLETFDVVIKSPGVSLYRPEIRAAIAKGTIVTSGTNIWFAEHPNDTTVCVTGTKGKSTTTSLIAHFLKYAGCHVQIGGNIGVPIIELMDAEADSSVRSPSAPPIYVFELSSYQTADFTGSPSVGVLLNLYSEHLDWHGSVESYFNDKLNLFARMRNGIAVINRTDPNTSARGLAPHGALYFNDANGIHVDRGWIWHRKTPLISTADVRLPGDHNLSNICAALTAVWAIGIAPKTVIPSIDSFRPLPHRLTLLGQKNGVDYVDDSISTVPQSTIAAVKSFNGRQITLIVGGFDRGVAFDELADYLTANPVFAVITMPQSGPRIAHALYQRINADTSPSVRVIEAKNLEHAVEIAKTITPSGGMVLLSPAAPSYGVFKNFQERGDAFARLAGFDIQDKSL